MAKELFDCFFPFNNYCEASFGSDVELRFDDGQSLYIHSKILSLASPILRNDVRKKGPIVLNMKESSREVWLVILNCLNPGNSYKHHKASHIDLVTDPHTIGILKECQKFKLRSVLSFFDSAMASQIRASQSYESLPVRKIASLATQFGLEDTLISAKSVIKANLEQSVEMVRTPARNKERARKALPASVSNKKLRIGDGLVQRSITSYLSPEAVATTAAELDSNWLDNLEPNPLKIDPITCPSCHLVFEHLRRTD